MEAKHTPGPWKIEVELGSRHGEFLIAKDAGDRGRGIAVAETRTGSGSERANARLIAAAPELLAALQDALQLIELVVLFDGDVTRNIRRAIAKATQ